MGALPGRSARLAPLARDTTARAAPAPRPRTPHPSLGDPGTAGRVPDRARASRASRRSTLSSRIRGEPPLARGSTRASDALHTSVIRASMPPFFPPSRAGRPGTALWLPRACGGTKKATRARCEWPILRSTVVFRFPGGRAHLLHRLRVYFPWKVWALSTRACTSLRRSRCWSHRLPSAQHLTRMTRPPACRRPAGVLVSGDVFAHFFRAVSGAWTLASCGGHPFTDDGHKPPSVAQKFRPRLCAKCDETCGRSGSHSTACVSSM